MFFNQTLKRKKELGSYSVGKIRFFGVGLDFALEPVYPLLSAVPFEFIWVDDRTPYGTRVPGWIILYRSSFYTVLRSFGVQ